MTRKKSIFALMVSMLFSATTSAAAVDLKLTSENGDVLAIYNQPMISELGLREIRTTTPWTDGVVKFEGTALRSILADAGVADRNVTALSMDDYAASMSADLINEHDPIVATRMNGKFLQAGNKGPFWIMFDFDAMPAEDAAEMHSYSVWHLNELEVE